MHLNFNDEILLNDTEPCIVSSKTNVHGLMYYLLININTLEELICYEEDGKLFEVGFSDLNSCFMYSLSVIN